MSDKDKTEELSLPIGEKIKRLREGACLSVEQLADRTGLNATELRRVEEDMISPALGDLIKICDGLGVRLGHFFDQGPRRFFSLFRSGDEPVMTRFASKTGVDFGYEYHALGSDKRNRFMEPFLITITHPTDAAGHEFEVEELSTHAGEEFLFVLEGQIEVHLEGESFVLGPGDSLYYDASMPHSVMHQGGGNAKVLAVVFLPRNR